MGIAVDEISEYLSVQAMQKFINRLTLTIDSISMFLSTK